MKKLYGKNELTFALVWIAIYVAGTSLAESLSETIGAQRPVGKVRPVSAALPSLAGFVLHSAGAGMPV